MNKKNTLLYKSSLVLYALSILMITITLISIFYAIYVSRHILQTAGDLTVLALLIIIALVISVIIILLWNTAWFVVNARIAHKNEEHANGQVVSFIILAASCAITILSPIAFWYTVFVGFGLSSLGLYA